MPVGDRLIEAAVLGLRLPVRPESDLVLGDRGWGGGGHPEHESESDRGTGALWLHARPGGKTSTSRGTGLTHRILGGAFPAWAAGAVLTPKNSAVDGSACLVCGLLFDRFRSPLFWIILGHHDHAAATRLEGHEHGGVRVARSRSRHRRASDGLDRAARPAPARRGRHRHQRGRSFTGPIELIPTALPSVLPMT